MNYKLKDYTVNTAITFHTGFDDRENNCLMYEGMKEKIKKDIQTAFLNDESLKGYITSDLTLRFLDGYKVRVEYEFSCYDENKQEAEGFSNYCVKGVQSRLEELGYRMESISSKAEEMDMGWLDELESMVFR
ncbi:MAG: hypothetical protein ACLTZG_28830 [Hungatella hathewayi]|uniref:hypothetical protein n=1 Tax=Hungatella hathewayi TaxID=154046 RepID=UPI002672C312|nr:hypothetical protein [Hungatella hathewayi]